VQDIYALGIILLELYHPFGTATERVLVLSDLREKLVLPPHIPLMFPEEVLRSVPHSARAFAHHQAWRSHWHDTNVMPSPLFRATYRRA
jgi:hypothetical protein